MPAQAVAFRHLWGETKPAQLTETAEATPQALYESVEPPLGLGLPFAPTTMSEGWFEWPSLA